MEYGRDTKTASLAYSVQKFGYSWSEYSKSVAVKPKIRAVFW